MLTEQSNDAVRVSAGAEHWLGLSEPSSALWSWWVVRSLGALLLLTGLWFASMRLAQLVAASGAIAH